MQKRWLKAGNPDENTVNLLAQDLNIHKNLAAVLVARGILNKADAQLFFRPQLAHLHDPFLMAGMNQAVERLNKAIANNEKVLVFGDYDVDGTTSVALVYSYLLQYYNQLDFYIPDRYTEGYGISLKGIDYAADNGMTLIIALDCGIKAHDKIDYAKQKGVDFIVCDHHLPGETLPDGIILDPKRNDCNYPYKELSGCGVGFKFMQAWTSANKKDESRLMEFIDFCAVSIAADIVPLTGENRILAYYGIKKLNESPSLGLKTLLQVSKKEKEITITDLLFVIGPRINAAGRITSGRFAVELLISANEEKAMEFASLINENNIERRILDKKITQEALALIKENPGYEKSKTTVLYNAEWHKGVIGIVASRVTEHYYRPTIMLTNSNGKATGSARSVKDFDVHAAIEQCADLLEQFGGHKYAAGLTIKTENIEPFRQRFEKIVSESITEDMLIPSIEVDGEINFDVLFEEMVEGLPKFYRILKQMAPFGPENFNPVFVAKGVMDAGYAKILGDSHLKCWLYQASNPQLRIDAIGFGLGHFYEKVRDGRPFDIAFSIEENEWQGKIKLQLSIKDIKMS
ncbi:MAG TPA: single-stranded-DNA-specific exonuclease RecJ [Flavobacteriales bacterium]|nr:single-stranded-DNA-specific exonuclease RecJ [Flavobacteriales bacterium]